MRASLGCTGPGRAVTAADNGHISAEQLVPACPAQRPILEAKPGQLTTQYEFAKAPVDSGRRLEGRMLRIFERGHVMEDCMVSWLREAGFHTTG